MVNLSYILEICGFLTKQINPKLVHYRCARKRRRLAMLILVVAVFAICWLPIHLFHILSDAELIYYNYQLYMTLHWLAMSSVMYNPFIYSWLNPDYRHVAVQAILELETYYPSIVQVPIEPKDPTMYGVNIQIANNQTRFTVGDTISGVVKLIAPVKTTLSDLSLWFHCTGEVKWIENVDAPHYTNHPVYNDKFDFHQEELRFTESALTVTSDDIQKKLSIPFSFIIPTDKILPSSMISIHGYVKYCVGFTIRQLHNHHVNKFAKEVIVLSPIEKDLMISVNGSAKKRVLLHNGTVSMHASIDRKGFAPGETVSVQVEVDNQTNTNVIPKISLSQVQIYMCGLRHKTIESLISRESIFGTEIGPHTRIEQLLRVYIPNNDSLSIKSSLITVKYFILVTLEIPHSFDLYISLPVVVTTKKVIDQTEYNHQ